MALKSNFEDADFISSPFVDEVANPGDTFIGRLSNKSRKMTAALDSAFDRKPPASAQISKADRKARITPAQSLAQARVNRAEQQHGAPDKNKNRDKAEGR